MSISSENGTEENPSLHYDDIVSFHWCKGDTTRTSNEENSSGSSVSGYIYSKGSGIDTKDMILLEENVSNLKMISFKIKAASTDCSQESNDQQKDVTHGAEVKLFHMYSKKYIAVRESEEDKEIYLSEDSDDCELILKKASLENNETLSHDEVILLHDEVIFQAKTKNDLYICISDECTKRPKEDVQKFYFTIHNHDDVLKKYMTKKGKPYEAIIAIKKDIDDDAKQNSTLNYVIRSLCLGHKEFLQDYFCYDKVLEKVCKLFHENKELDVLNTLITMCVGNFDNHEVFLIMEKPLEAIKEILMNNDPFDIKKLTQRPPQKHCNCLKCLCDENCENLEYCKETYWKIKKNEKENAKYLIELKASAVLMLEILCEEIHPNTEKNVKTLVKHIDIMDLHEIMFICYMLKKGNGDEIAELARDTAIKTHNLLKHMEDFKGIKTMPTKNKLKSKNDDQISESDEQYYTDYKRWKIDEKYYADTDYQKVWNYCLKWSRSIEISYLKDDERPAKVYFRLHPEDEMTPKEENIVKHHVNCDRPKNRLTQFLLGMDSIEKKVHPHFFKTRRKISRKTCISVYELINLLLTIWTVLMNILLIIAWENVDIKSEIIYHSSSASNGFSKYCLEAVCYNNSVKSSVFTPQDCNHSLCVSEAHIPTVPDTNDHPHWFFCYTLYCCGAIHSILSLLMLVFFIALNVPNYGLSDCKYICEKFSKSVYNQIYMFKFKQPKPPDYFEELEPPKYFASFYIFCFRLLYVLGFVACSGLALRFYGYFYCICLIHIVVDNTVLQRVLKSFTKNLTKLFWLVALGLVMIYIYSVGAFVFFANQFHDPDSRNAQYCNSLLQCWITIFHYILIGGTTNLPDNFKEFAIRVIFFEVTFYIIITIVGINIIYAIVIDTFIELRDEWWKIERDNRQICFICQKFSSKFEKRGQGFNHHIMNDHYMFNYVYFKLHIDKVAKEKRNAMERYVFEKVKAKKIDFFPLNCARCLKQTKTREKLDELTSIADKLNNTVDETKEQVALNAIQLQKIRRA